MKLAIALCTLAGPLFAQTARLDVQGLVDLAEPGSTVRLPACHEPSLVVDKSLTIVCEPRATIDHIRLDGPGMGEVVLANLKTTTDLDGAGFVKVSLVDMEILGAVRPTGVVHLEIVRSTVGTTTPNVNDIVAPGADVLLLDVQFASGNGRIVADDVYHTAGCSPVQGAGINRTNVLPDDLMMAGTMNIGQRFTLTWNTPGPRHALLFGALGTRRPTTVPGWSGFWHLDHTAMLLGGIPAGGGPRSMGTWIPFSRELIGAKIVVQVLDGPDYLSRPVIGVVRP